MFEEMYNNLVNLPARETSIFINVSNVTLAQINEFATVIASKTQIKYVNGKDLFEDSCNREKHLGQMYDDVMTKTDHLVELIKMRRLLMNRPLRGTSFYINWYADMNVGLLQEVLHHYDEVITKLRLYEVKCLISVPSNVHHLEVWATQLRYIDMTRATKLISITLNTVEVPSKFVANLATNHPNLERVKFIYSDGGDRRMTHALIELLKNSRIRELKFDDCTNFFDTKRNVFAFFDVLLQKNIQFNVRNGGDVNAWPSQSEIDAYIASKRSSRCDITCRKVIVNE